ncbi:uncharacterized protein EI97DRAFT_459152 [Westerdykella ornata]|uniref:C2H2-type domain-containing protein n=1 Tax=Westerdykella ornata TaxID=318751 RepID=A0A6A6JGC1_WESOR|nr:uncharacterized protein EI97DRAFT_459152 [Westerdykella ornata]KAF2275690.1 hypothetical protein EI97DRAFT_459152 [Westerdykella ornata]
MEAITVGLQELQSSSFSTIIPREVLQKYDELEDAAFRHFGKEPLQWSVYFHLKDGKCGGRIDSYYWDRGSYYNASCLTAGCLEVFAHFEPKPNVPTSGTPTVNPAIHAPTTSLQVSSGAATLSSSGAAAAPTTEATLNLGEPRGATDEPTQCVTSRSHVSQSQKRPSEHALHSEKESHLEQPSQHTRHTLPLLPDGTASEDHEISLPAFTSNNRPYGQNATNNVSTISNLSRARKKRRTTALAADTPDLTEERYVWPIDGMHKTGCVDRFTRADNLRAHIRNIHPESPQAQSLNVERARPPLLRRARIASDGQTPICYSIVSSGVSKGAIQYFCPVAEEGRCEREDGIVHWLNFERHMKSKHPGVPYTKPGAESSSEANQNQTRSEGPGGPKQNINLLCPVRECSEAFKDFDLFQDHIRVTHPTSNHALVLDAVANNTSPVLNPAAPIDDFLADYELCKYQNAEAGEFGHRDPDKWEAIQQGTRNRLALARLIHNKYGILASEPCGACRNGGTTCLVLHPELRNKLKFGSTCSECRNGGKMCSFAQKTVFEPSLGDAALQQQTSRVNGNEDTVPGVNKNTADKAHKNGQADDEEEEEEEDDDSGVHAPGLNSLSSSFLDGVTSLEEPTSRRRVGRPLHDAYSPGFFSGEINGLPTVSGLVFPTVNPLVRPERAGRRRADRIPMSPEAGDQSATQIRSATHSFLNHSHHPRHPRHPHHPRDNETQQTAPGQHGLASRGAQQDGVSQTASTHLPRTLNRTA